MWEILFFLRISFCTILGGKGTLESKNQNQKDHVTTGSIFISGKYEETCHTIVLKQFTIKEECMPVVLTNHMYA